MDKRAREYEEDDVFSLEEDLARERRRQWVQYILVALCAAAVVALALYGSILLTRQRIASQNAVKKAEVVVTPVTDPANPDAPPVEAPDTNFWPTAFFPDVPPIEALAYDTQAEPGYAVVNVPATTSRSFGAYIDALTEAGGKLYVRTTRLSIVDYNGTEIHLVANNLRTQVVLCGEAAYGWNDETYKVFPLPAAGKLVQVADGTGAGSRVLTYRGANVHDALDYAGSLAQAGWSLSGSLEPANNIFQAVYKKNNLQITVDYFSSGDNYLVKLDYLS